ncbi:MAG: aldo/keto reductase [Rhodospirillaceae bacterium]|nr:aldo/keto reductase [Rhodospirillaceae bacterium]
MLGTVQLGMPYGKLRQFAFPSNAEAVALMRRAADIGITDFDTARNYGIAEMRLGDAFGPIHDPARTIVTKLHPLQHVPLDAPEWAVRAAIDASIFASCRALRTRHLPVLLLHLVFARHAWKGAAWRRLLELRDEGIISKLGVSVVNPEEALEYVSDPEVKHMQVPINILDRRWGEMGLAERFAARPDITVHARSIFLQGVLLQDDPAGWPQQAGSSAGEIIRWLRQTAHDLDQASVAQLAVNYLRSLGWIDGLVIGVENEGQLVNNLSLFKMPLLDAAGLARIEATRPAVEDWLLDPGKW